ncbi:MAG: chitosanase [Reyranella sp.]|uniref:chitosanase n=1 Tax=Reyranella sp. TaxID=1929291 RepID=UPI001AD25130|nr:chitosanase [Reyranella sp.]MBN9088335.1 chitosanase [Reyranella sp.]
MFDQSSQSVSPEMLRRLTDAAQTVNTVAAHLAEVAAMSGQSATAAGAGVAAAAMLVLTPSQRAICERVINVFETGSVRGRYGAIAIFGDGPHNIRQITYGRSQTTEYGNLRELVSRYAGAGGTFSDQLRPFVPLIGRTALVDNATFKDLLRRAGNEDPVMESVQDAFFADRYFNPAMRWAGTNGFTRALSALVIYDSFIHSGGILDFLRTRFRESPPARGGNEQVWISQYTETRHNWLLTHSNPPVRASAYRTADLLREIGRGNWDLALVPIMANGTPVDDGGIGHGAIAAVAAVAEAPEIGSEIPYLGDEAAGEIWCEGGSGSASAAAAGVMVDAAASSAVSLAQQILADTGISLATAHASGIPDQATARQNIVDTAAGRPASRSSYQGAPGGTVSLDIRMLGGVVALAQQYTFAVSEFCGGSHSANSRHYAGVTADFNIINGRHVSPGHPDVPAFMARCRALGATEVLGPGFPGHDNHIHAAWPRPV